MTSQNENQIHNSAEAPQPYGGQATDRFAQGQQQGQENRSSDAGAGAGGEERQYSNTRSTSDTFQSSNVPTSQRTEERQSPNTRSTSDTFQSSNVPTSHRTEDHPGGDQSERPFSGAPGGAPGGGGPTQSSMQQTQRTSIDTGDQSDSKRESGIGSQMGIGATGQSGTTAGMKEGDTTTSGTPGGTAQGTGSKSLKNVASGVHGAGEAIRGKMMQGIDEIFGHEAGAEKNREIAQAGMEKMRGGLGMGGTAGSGGRHGGNQGTLHGAGVTKEQQGTAPQAGEMGPKETRY